MQLMQFLQKEKRSTYYKCDLMQLDCKESQKKHFILAQYAGHLIQVQDVQKWKWYLWVCTNLY